MKKELLELIDRLQNDRNFYDDEAIKDLFMELLLELNNELGKENKDPNRIRSLAATILRNLQEIGPEFQETELGSILEDLGYQIYLRYARRNL